MWDSIPYYKALRDKKGLKVAILGMGKSGFGALKLLCALGHNGICLDSATGEKAQAIQQRINELDRELGQELGGDHRGIIGREFGGGHSGIIGGHSGWESSEDHGESLGGNRGGQYCQNPGGDFSKSIELLTIPDLKDPSISKYRLPEVEILIISPGLPFDNAIVKQAKARKVPVIQEVELGLNLSGLKAFGITGSNGKTTTASLLADILSLYGRVALCGNIGFPASLVAYNQLFGQEKYDYAVVELSSFQLMGIENIYLEGALINNLAPDHLDWHGTKEAYYQAKSRIFSLVRPGGPRVINLGDPESVKYLLREGEMGTGFGSGQEGAKIVPQGEKGQGKLLVWRDGKHIVWRGEKLISVDEIGLLGQHNIENVMAALALIGDMPVDKGKIREKLSKFKGISHRLELVGESGGIAFVNDSKATNVAAAITGILAIEGPIILIAGGRKKNEPWEPLIEAARNRVKKVVLIGECARELGHYFSRICPVEYVSNMENAVKMAYHSTEKGDTVLLSPACASYDMFADYEKRGQAFAAAARAIIEDKACEPTKGP